MSCRVLNIAERAAYLATHDAPDVPLDFTTMGKDVQTMVRESLEALIRSDGEVARKVIADDDVVDNANRAIIEMLQRVMSEDPNTVVPAVHLLSASRHLERIADLATNIAEDVVFMVEGEIVRHHVEDFRHGEG